MLISAPSTSWNIRQMIEIKTGNSGKFYVGSTHTLSFYVRGVAGTVIDFGTAFRDSIASGTNAVIDILSSNIHTISTSLAWEKVEYTFTVSATAGATNQGYELRLSSASTNEIRVSGVQLEEGSIATSFEQRPIGLELSLCQRYYETSLVYCMAYENSSTTVYTQFNTFTVQKRDTPTVELSDYTSSGYTKGTLNVSGLNVVGYRGLDITASGATGGQAALATHRFKADAEL